MSKWTLFSNHGHVLVVLSRDPDARLRDVAQIVGITERAVQKIVRDLQDGGLVSVTKQGRRNRYRLHPNQPLRHSLEAHCTTGELLEMVNRRAPGHAADDVDELPVPVNAVESARAPAQTPPGPAPGTEAATVPSSSTPPATADQRKAPKKDAAPPSEPSKAPADDGDQGSLF